ncbi:MAG: hypothetical protein HKN79_09355, partial [Flavobacteriales bacterium]|nr:hypothetical protein [Flavobacteriales bacterium]
MVAVQHSTKDDRIYHKQARSLAQAGFEVSMVTSNPSGVPVDMASREVDPGPDAYGISHYCVKEPSNPVYRLLKRYYSGPFYADMHTACV